MKALLTQLKALRGGERDENDDLDSRWLNDDDDEDENLQQDCG